MFEYLCVSINTCNVVRGIVYMETLMKVLATYFIMNQYVLCPLSFVCPLIYT